MTYDPDLMDNGRYWTANDSRCEFCGHTFRTDTERTEQYDPEGDGPSVICCQPCGDARNYEMEADDLTRQWLGIQD